MYVFSSILFKEELRVFDETYDEQNHNPSLLASS